MEAVSVKEILAIIFVFVVAVMNATAQGKGVDQSSERVRDTGSNRAPVSNGTKQDTGAGRGIDFGKERAPTRLPIPNPYRFTARRDTISTAVMTVMHDRKMIVDESASKPNEGILVSQPYTFIKGAVVSQNELNRYAELPTVSARGWTRGRYTIIVEIQPIDGLNANVSVNAKVEGRTDGASGAEWVTLRSSGIIEQEFLTALIENITGGPPPARPNQ